MAFKFNKQKYSQQQQQNTGFNSNQQMMVDRNKSFDPKQREVQESPNSVFIHTSEKVVPTALVRMLEEVVGSNCVEKYFFREKQNFGFVQFANSEDIERAIERVSGQEFEGATITVERCRNSIQPQRPAKQMVPSAVSQTGDQQAPMQQQQQPMPPPEPSNSLVVKNLPFSFKMEDFQDLLNTFDVKPQHLKYHFDGGNFRGIAFVKYRNIEQATAMWNILNGYEVHGRKLRAEYKRGLVPKNGEPEFEDEEMQTLFEQLSKFRDDPTSTEMSFAADLTNQQRKQIHYIAERLDLVHYSQGEGDQRSIIVAKRGQKPQPALSTSPTSEKNLEKNWRLRMQQEKEQKALLGLLPKIAPVRQPKLPEPNVRGFSEEYRNSRKLRQHTLPPMPAAATPPSNSINSNSSPASASASASASAPASASLPIPTPTAAIPMPATGSNKPIAFNATAPTFIPSSPTSPALLARAQTGAPSDKPAK